MTHRIFAAAILCASLTFPAAAMADEVGLVGGAVAGALVAGPIGLVVGAVAGNVVTDHKYHHYGRYAAVHSRRTYRN
jgi:hypothetical protein